LTRDRRENDRDEIDPQEEEPDEIDPQMTPILADEDRDEDGGQA